MLADVSLRFMLEHDALQFASTVAEPTLLRLNSGGVLRYAIRNDAKVPFTNIRTSWKYINIHDNEAGMPSIVLPIQ